MTDPLVHPTAENLRAARHELEAAWRRAEVALAECFRVGNKVRRLLGEPELPAEDWSRVWAEDAAAVQAAWRSQRRCEEVEGA